MDAGNNSGRFYSSSSLPSSAQQPSAASPTAQIRHNSLGSDLVSDGDFTTSQYLRLGYDIQYRPLLDEIAYPHAYSRSLSNVAAIDGSVGQYVPSGLDAARRVPVFDPTGLQGRFDAPIYPFHPADAFVPPRPSAMPYTIPVSCSTLI